MPATSGCRAGLTTNYHLVKAGAVWCFMVSLGKGRWQETAIWQLLSRCHLHSNIQETTWSAGGDTRVGRGSPFPELPVWRGRETRIRLLRCAKCLSCTGLCGSQSPLTGSLSPHPSPAPSVRGGAGKEDGRHRVSGGPGRLLGCSLLLLPPGKPGLSSGAPSAPCRPSTFCYWNKKLVLHSWQFFFH